MLGEWMSTGDQYREDEDGFFWYEGRSDDMFKVGGLWVSPIDMENTLVEHQAVLEVAVVSVPVEDLNRNQSLRHFAQRLHRLTGIG